MTEATPSAKPWSQRLLPALLVAAFALLVPLALFPSTGTGASREDQPDALGPLDIAKVELKQSGRNSRALLKTRGRWRLGGLDPNPRLHDERPPDHLCLELWQDGRHTRSCFGKSPRGRPIVVQARISKRGRALAHTRLKTRRFKQPNRSSVELVLRFRELGLDRGRFRWRAISGWDDPDCYPDLPEEPGPSARRPKRAADPLGCTDGVPDRGRAKGKIRRPRIVGCSRDQSRVNSNGSRKRKRIALTFDDGPSAYTGQILATLDRYHAKGTFYVLGSQVGGRQSLLRRMIRGRHEIGNHSGSHSPLPPCRDVAGASRCIKRATGFEPCTFRPPYGALSGSLVDSVWRLGMSTVLWDVDTSDWRLPGSGAIVSRALAAKSGSIVLMHDGGGYRGQTVAALPRIVNTLKRRGYRLVTVSRLLGERFRWKP